MENETVRVPSNTFNAGGNSKELTLFDRIACSKESQIPASKLIVKYGYPKPKNPNDMAHKLTAIALNHGETFLTEIANIHPDRDLILKTTSSMNDAGSEKLNCAGCGGTCSGAKKLNSCGCKHNDGGSSDGGIIPPHEKANAVKDIAKTHAITKTVVLCIVVVAVSAIAIHSLKIFKPSK